MSNISTNEISMSHYIPEITREPFTSMCEKYKVNGVFPTAAFKCFTQRHCVSFVGRTCWVSEGTACRAGLKKHNLANLVA